MDDITRNLVNSFDASTPVGDAGLYIAGVGYFDWTSSNDDGAVVFEVGDDQDGAVQVIMTTERMMDLHRRLTVWLLQQRSMD